MISRAANRAALAAVPEPAKPRHLKPKSITSHRRYQLRQAGCVSPLEYGTIDQALDALG